MLLNMGYEVYCPKMFSLLDMSGSISYDYDSSLTIPIQIISQLNKIDFYQSLSSEEMDLINQYFDIAICIFNSSTLESLLRLFKGQIILHTFGIIKPDNYTRELTNNYSQFNLLALIKQVGNRFWYAPSYEILSEIEAPVLRNRAIFCPIGFSKVFAEKQWVGGEKKLLFVSPKIKSNPYYEKVYHDFINNFGDIPHVIGGAQLQSVTEDPTVTGFLPKEEYEYNMTHLAVMFYHSQEPYHIHHHPLEAIRFGMPLVFMAGGMLDHLGGSHLPGRCETIAEARKKIKRLLNGDKKLEKSIIDSQRVILNNFSMEYCRPFWEKAFSMIENSIDSNSNNNTGYRFYKKTKKIAVVMPNKYLGGVLDYSVRLSEKIQTVKNEENVEVVFSYPEDEKYTDLPIIKRISSKGISIRSMNCEERNGEWVQDALDLAGFLAPNDYIEKKKRYCVFNDSISNFADCDFLILTADRSTVLAPFFSTKPFIVVAHDFIQRYIPDLFTKKQLSMINANLQNAMNVWTTSKPSYDNAISYAGLPKEKVLLTPYLLELGGKIINDKKNDMDAQEYFVWITNTSKHKNHLRALKALKGYYNNGGRLKCIITGVGTDLLLTGSIKDEKLSEYVEDIKTEISNSRQLKDNIIVKGYLDICDYEYLVKDSAFIFHPGYADNGNGSAADGARYGIPFICSDYPEMRYLANFIGINPVYFDPFDVEDIEEKLLYAEKEYKKLKKEMPNHRVLFEHYNNKTNQQIKEIMYSVVGE